MMKNIRCAHWYNKRLYLALIDKFCRVTRKKSQAQLSQLRNFADFLESAFGRCIEDCHNWWLAFRGTQNFLVKGAETAQAKL